MLILFLIAHADVSIHAPAGGATRRPLPPAAPPPVFQFTLPRGERPVFSSAFLAASKFQFTLPRGERQLVHEAAHYAYQFQFTLPRGERPNGARMSR